MAQPNIFDRLAEQDNQSQGNIFDKMASEDRKRTSAPQGNVFDRMAATSPAQPAQNDVTPFARAYQKTPYKMGGEDACSGSDCSSFTQKIMAKKGIAIPRTAAEQYTQGERVDLQNLQPGDLVFKAGTYKPGISHVGVVLPGGKIANMKSTKAGYQEDDVAKWLADKKTVGARRFLKGAPVATQNPNAAMYQQTPNEELQQFGQDVGGLVGGAAGQPLSRKGKIAGQVAGLAAELGMTPEEARLKGISPTVEGIGARSYKPYSTFNQLGPVVSDTQTGHSGYVAPQSPVKLAMDTALGQGTYDAFHNLKGEKKGFRGQLENADTALSQLLVGMVEPENVALLYGTAGIGAAAPVLRPLIGAAFAGMMGKGAYDKAKEGDYGGAAVLSAAALLAGFGSVKERQAYLRDLKAKGFTTAQIAATVEAAKTAEPIHNVPRRPVDMARFQKASERVEPGSPTVQAEPVPDANISPKLVHDTPIQKESGRDLSAVEQIAAYDRAEAQRATARKTTIQPGDTVDVYHNGRGGVVLQKGVRVEAVDPAGSGNGQVGRFTYTDKAGKDRAGYFNTDEETWKHQNEKSWNKKGSVSATVAENVSHGKTADLSTNTPEILTKQPITSDSAVHGKEPLAGIKRAVTPAEPLPENVARATIETPKPAEMTGIKHAVTDAEADAMGHPITKQASRVHQEIQDAAVQRVKAEPEYPRQLAAEVVKKNRPLTVDEEAVLLEHRKLLKGQHFEAEKELAQAINAGDEVARVRASQKVADLEDDFLKNTEASRHGGSEIGRALGFRRNMLKLDDDKSELATLTRATIKKGSALTVEETEQYKALARLHEEAAAKVTAQQEAIAQRDAQIQELQSKQASKVAIKRIDAQEKLQAGRSVRRATKQDLSKEFKDLVTSLKPKPKDGGRLNAGLPLGERYEHIDIVPTFKKMVANLHKRGIVNADEIVQTIHTAALEHLPDLTVREVRDAISGYGRQVTRTASDAAKQMRDLQKQMRLISAIEDAEARVPIAKGNAPGKPSKAVSALRSKLDALLEETGQKPKPVRTVEGRQAAKQKALERAIDDLDRRIKTGDVSSRRAAGVPETELTARLTAERKALKKQYDAMKPPAPKPDSLAAVKRRTQAQIDKLGKQLAEGNFLPNPSRVPVRPDTELLRMRSDLDAMKLRQRKIQVRIDKKIARLEKPTIGDYLLGTQRGFLTTGIGTFEHLSGAALARLILTTVEEVSGGVQSQIPGIKTVAALAPREGGFNLRAEANAFGALKNVPREFKNELKGMSTLEAKYGHPYESKLPAIFDIPGRTHAAFKTPAVLAEFARSVTKRTAHAVKAGMDISSEPTQQAIGEAAYLDAMRAKLQQPNPANEAFNAGLRALEQKGTWGKGGAFLLKAALPIREIPMNYVSEMVDYLPWGGLVKGLEVAREARAAGKMTPEQADAIMRSWKKQGVGAAAALLLHYGYLKAGGTYKNQGKAAQDDLKPGEIEIFGQRMNAHFSHSPLGVSVNVLADFQHGMDTKRFGDDAGVGNALGRATSGAVTQVPFVAETARAGSATENPNNLGKYVGNIIKGFVIPRGVQEVATMRDTDVTGQPVIRKTKGFTDMFKAGTPRQRQTLEPFNMYQEFKDKKTVEELRRLSVNIEPPTSTIDVNSKTDKVKLSGSEMKTYLDLFKKAVGAQLKNFVNGPTYDAIPDEKKPNRLKEQIQIVRDKLLNAQKGRIRTGRTPAR